jgi:hypothetical protein
MDLIAARVWFWNTSPEDFAIGKRYNGLCRLFARTPTAMTKPHRNGRAYQNSTALYRLQMQRYQKMLMCSHDHSQALVGERLKPTISPSSSRSSASIAVDSAPLDAESLEAAKDFVPEW